MKMTDRELLAQIEEFERRSTNYYGTEVSAEMRVAQDYYLGKPIGNEEEGRSQVISSDVWDVVEGMTPAILGPFVASDDVVRFEPVGAEDIETAEQETELINHIVTQQNNVFETLVAWVKQGLLQKNGIVKYWWEESETPRIERYDDLTDDVYTLLISDPRVTVKEHTEEADELTGEPTHDVVVRFAEKAGCAKYAVIPHEEFRIDSDHTSGDPSAAKFVQHPRLMTISALREMGYDVDDDVSDAYDFDPRTSELYQARRTQSEQQGAMQYTDASMREVLYRETYIRVDFDGDGIAELRKVCAIGQTVLHNEETEEIPFCAWSPYPQPFKFYGRCPADETTEIQLLKTTLLRQSLDNIYTINNNRTFVGNRVNIDDLVDNAIGGHIRVDSDSVGSQVYSAPIQPIGGVIQPMIEYLDSAKETRTGFTRYNQGTDANSLNKTATGVRLITEASNLRLDLIRRNFAEMGLKRLMLGVHGLTRRHATKALVVRLRGKYVPVDPRDWRSRADMSVSVGLGSADKQMQLQGIQMLMAEQKQLAQAGLATPKNIYASASKLANALGYKDPETYFTAPPDEPPAPPDPMQNPEFMLKMAESKRKDRELDLKERELDMKKEQNHFDNLFRSGELELKVAASMAVPVTDPIVAQEVGQMGFDMDSSEDARETVEQQEPPEMDEAQMMVGQMGGEYEQE